MILYMLKYNPALVEEEPKIPFIYHEVMPICFSQNNVYLSYCYGFFLSTREVQGSNRIYTRSGVFSKKIIYTT
jgi:hypothetical protein